MKLKTKKVEGFEVDYDDLEKFLQHHFKLDNEFSVVACWEMGNDSTKEIYLDGNIGDYEREKILKRDFDSYGAPQAMMNKLCQDGLLEKGIYWVNICR